MTQGPVRRLFVAIRPPAAALEHLGRAVDHLAVSQGDGAAARLTARDGWHVTLAFLGQPPAERGPDAVRDASSAIVRSVGGWAGGLRLRLAGCGTFGAGDRQILWVGLGGDVAGLRQLAGSVRYELGVAGLASDGREFRPHLTITRPGAPVGPELIATDVVHLHRYEGPWWTVDAVDLVASQTVPTEAGPRSRYTILTSTDL